MTPLLDPRARAAIFTMSPAAALRRSQRLPPVTDVLCIHRRTLLTSQHDSGRTTLPTPSELSSARTHCLGVLRKFDSPAHTLLPFIPPQARDAYLSLRALNVELALLPDTTSSLAIAQIRAQFWRDATAAALRGQPPREPTTLLLSHAAATLSSTTSGRSRLPGPFLSRLVDARASRLGDPPFPTLAALESHAESAHATVLYLTLSALPLASLAADHLASHIGKAAGIAAALRGLPLAAFPAGARHGAVPLPLDVMADAGVREEDVLRRGPAAAGLRDAVFAVATRANDHLITAREMLRGVREGRGAGHEFEEGEREAVARGRGGGYGAGGAEAARGKGGAEWAEVERGFGVLMPAVATRLWLERLERADFDVFAPELRRADWRLPWRAWWAHKRRTL